MDRRDALKALGSIATATGITVTPITETQAEHAALLVLRTPAQLTAAECERLRDLLVTVARGTPLAGVRVVVLTGGMSLELVTR